MPEAQSMSPEEAAVFMNADPEIFMEMVRRGNIPFHDGNPHMTFQTDEIEALPGAVLNAPPRIDPIAARAALYSTLI